MIKVSVSDAITIFDSSTPEFHQSQEALKSYLTQADIEAQANQAELDALSDRLIAPVNRLIEADRDAFGALEYLRKREMVQADNLHQPDLVLEKPFDPIVEANVFVLRPPFDPRSGSSGVYQGSRPAHSTLNRSDNGYVGIDARSGSMNGGQAGRVDAYSGFGFVFRPNASGTFTAGAQVEGCRFVYNVGCRGVGGSAVAEGRLSIVVTRIMPPGLVTAAHTQLWRRRVSGFETGRDEQTNLRPVVSTGRFNLNPGSLYAMSAVLNCSSDRSPGAGVAASQSVGEGFFRFLYVA
jgi:hypothetical protein